MNDLQKQDKADNSAASAWGSSSSYKDRMKDRLANGHAWMICNECGGKLYDLDGYEDRDRSCPFKKNGKCEPR